MKKYYCVHEGKVFDNLEELIEIQTGENASFYISKDGFEVWQKNLELARQKKDLNT